MNRLHIISLALLISALPLTANADFNSAMRDYDRGHITQAEKELKILSRQHNPYAQFQLGKLWAGDKGHSRDYIKAFTWFSLAEKNGIRAAEKKKRELRKKMSLTQLKKANRLIAQYDAEYRSFSDRHEYTSKKTVRDIQYKLKKRGYYQHKVDGILDWNTRKAIRKYQQDNWLRVDGRITKILLTSLDNRRDLHKTNFFSWSFPNNYQSNSYSNSSDTLQMRRELRDLAKDAKHHRAAADWVIRRLENLASR